MRGFLLYFVLLLQAKLVKLEFSRYYAGDYDLNTIRAHEDVERRKCEHLPYKTVFTVTPGFNSFKFTCIIRKEDGCSRDEVYKYRLVESRAVNGLEYYEALIRAVVRDTEPADEKLPICIFDYSVNTKVAKKEVYHQCEDGWLYTEPAERIKLMAWAGANPIDGRRVPMCYKTFKQTLTKSGARDACKRYNAVVAPIRSSIEETAFMNSFHAAFPNGLSDGYGWVGMENKCQFRTAAQRCFIWDYDGKQLGFSIWKDQPNALARPGFDHERCVLFSFGDYPNYGYTDYHCECTGELCKQYPLKAVICAKEATPPPNIPTQRRIQYHCDDDTWILSRRSMFNGIPLCYKGDKVYGSPSFDESKKLCTKWGAAIAPIGNQDDMGVFHKAMDRVFPGGDAAGKFVYIAWRNAKVAVSDKNVFISDWDSFSPLPWISRLNWFNESSAANSSNVEPDARVHPGVPGWEDCVIADLGKRKWRDWYCRCTDKTKCVLEEYPRAGIACAKPANQFIY